MRQRSVLQKLLEKLVPGLGCPLVIWLRGSQIGWIRTTLDLRQPVARGVINGVGHSVYGYEGNSYGVYRLQEQVGLIQRAATAENDADVYHADFNGDLDPALCACLILFIDLVWHRHDAEFRLGRSSEWTFQIGGARLDPAWRPNDKNPSSINGAP